MPSVSVSNITIGGTLTIPSSITGTFRNIMMDSKRTESEMSPGTGTQTGYTISLTFKRKDVLTDVDPKLSTSTASPGPFTILVDSRLQVNATYDITPQALDASGNVLATGTIITGVRTITQPMPNPNNNTHNH